MTARNHVKMSVSDLEFLELLVPGYPLLQPLAEQLRINPLAIGAGSQWLELRQPARHRCRHGRIGQTLAQAEGQVLTNGIGRRGSPRQVAGQRPVDRQDVQHRRSQVETAPGGRGAAGLRAGYRAASLRLAPLEGALSNCLCRRWFSTGRGSVWWTAPEPRRDCAGPRPSARNGRSRHPG